MTAAERIRTESCGCRYDVVTSLTTHYCGTHNKPAPEPPVIDLMAALVKSLKEPPATWARPAGFTGPCPGCGSTTCPGWYKPDPNHLLAV